jgi:hypothetical protein
MRAPQTRDYSLVSLLRAPQMRDYSLVSLLTSDSLRRGRRNGEREHKAATLEPLRGRGLGSRGRRLVSRGRGLVSGSRRQ